MSLTFLCGPDVELRLQAGAMLRSMYTLSPFVWRSGDGFHILLRAVNHDADATKKIARIYWGESPDGLNFAMAPEPAIAPGPDAEDLHGCEDPSVAEHAGELYVYYTGWNQRERVGRLLLAHGPDARCLRKAGVALDSTPTHANPKEAEIARRSDGSWALFFEYARAGRSRIGMATSANVTGPWHVSADPFDARPGLWDGWHLSPGPLVPHNGGVVMFYNGATHEAAWRIGWVLFDRDMLRVVERGGAPLIEPPPPLGDDTDIAFAASAVSLEAKIWLYYSLADRELRRVELLGQAKT